LCRTHQHNFHIYNCAYEYWSLAYHMTVSTCYQFCRGWTVRGSNPGGGEIFRSRPDRPWGLHNVQWVPGVKRPGRGIDHPPPSSAEVKERVELYLYSPSGPSWPVLRRSLPFFYLTSSVDLCKFAFFKISPHIVNTFSMTNIPVRNKKDLSS
jgi:hypothetical protein